MGLSLTQFWKAFGISGGGGLNTPTPLGTPLALSVQPSAAYQLLILESDFYEVRYKSVTFGKVSPLPAVLRLMAHTKFCPLFANVLPVSDWIRHRKCAQNSEFPENRRTESHTANIKGKDEAMPWQAWTGPEGSRTMRLPDFKTVSTWWW
jgi:hypothetical protein